jgi:transcriptional regulator of NAD metabolism
LRAARIVTVEHPIGGLDAAALEARAASAVESILKMLGRD